MRPGQYLFAGNALLNTNPRELLAAAEEAMPADARWREALAIDALDLEREYVRLFLDPRGAPCPIWQSVFVGEGELALLMGDSHSSALSFFYEYEMRPALNNEPADHAGLLLLFAGMLVERMVSSEEFERFRIRHLDWIAGLGARIEAETRLEFYRLLARELLSRASEAESPRDRACAGTE